MGAKGNGHKKGSGKTKKGINKARRVEKHFARDLDQILDDLAHNRTENPVVTTNVDAIDLPGLGQFYCVHCSRYFGTQKNLDDHVKTKPHKKRLRRLKEKPFLKDEAEAGAGMAPADNGPRLRPQLAPAPVPVSMADD
eukprot:JP448331.1.p1 GENE.JP448331.1~~JP448331.1.p1  ORF type:complete len:146 (+),score=14.91 JP448331.1:26-439(+)